MILTNNSNAGLLLAMTVSNTTNMTRNLSERIVGTMVLCFIIVTTIFGNILVTWSILTYRPLKKVQNLFLISLAMADMCVATLVMPLHVMKFLIDYWPLGKVICMLWITCDIMLCTASILNLCAIAIDRYCAIHDPIHYANKRTKRFVLTVVGVVWLLSALISIPPLLGWNDWKKADMNQCTYTTDRGFVIYSALGSFYIPLLIMTTIYCKIFFTARRRIQKHSTVRRGISVVAGREEKAALAASRKKTHPPNRVNMISERESLQLSRMDSAPSNVRNSEDYQLISDEHVSRPKRGFSYHGGKMMNTFKKSRMYQNKASEPEMDEPDDALRGYFKEREKISLSKEKKAAKTLAIIMGVFVLCWLPFFIFYVLESFIEGGLIHPKVYEAANWLGYINSSLNPIIYTIFNLDFRKAFKKILYKKH